jgi:hypothetical protein
MRASERIYWFLLRGYPRSYRERYAGPMACAFRDQLREARSAWAIARLWARTLADLALTVPARHCEVRVANVGYSEEYRLTLYFARQEAGSFGRDEITVEHLLLGLLRGGRQLPPEDARAIVRAIETAEASARRIPEREKLPLSRGVKVAMFRAAAEATREGTKQVEARHLLAGILAQKDTLAARLLRARGFAG